MSGTSIVSMRHHLAHPKRGKNLLFVRLETADGRHGWGECYTQADRDLQIVAHLNQLERYVVTWDARHIKKFTDSAFNDFAARRGAMDYYSAISGLEQAMWDLAGKRAGMPVHAMLGGACRERVRVYANGWAAGGGLPELVQSARETVDRGFTALKFDPIPGTWRTFVDRNVEDEAIARVEAVRSAVGPDVDILVEMHRRLAPMHAIRIAAAIEQYRPYWFEEPVLAENVKALADVRRSINIPVVTGEELYTKFEFREVFEQSAADIINPDVCNAMAEPYFVAVSPHNYNSTTIGLAATIQVAAVMPNFIITEYFVNLEQFGRDIADPPFTVVDSHIDVPDRPGLGIDLDEAALERYPYEPFPARAIGENPS